MNEIIAQEGMWLTQANLINESKRGFWKRLYPAISLTANDFVEWTTEQKEQWELEHHKDNEEEISDSEALEIITSKN